MPELPEVECLARAVRHVLLGKQIKKAEFHRADLRWPIPIDEFRQRMLDRPVLSVERRSKYLLIETEAGYAIVHLGMSGNIFYSQSRESPWKHTHASFQIVQDSDVPAYLHYVDPRRFGCILTCSPAELSTHPLLKDLGPEPLEAVQLDQLLWDQSRGKSVAVKNFLMDAHNLVGVGNIYANEALFLAGVRPTRRASAVKREEWTKLAAAIKAVLTDAIAAGGTSFRDYKHVDGESGYFAVSLRVYGRGAMPCVQCTQSIILMKLGGRASYFCRHCQR
ncbi:MAG: bifunctional DNA-formamidopyrimidine glycosylase/DNA-(apurinic or apyrimidinic site) lyase [Proteobacteria bacterium]|nr:bifunctional DNA-formamidopyrimidine glycosylase/DNA-(apurinic or apyrimidinic site) lyase [Pseudomonadota bacterium]